MSYLAETEKWQKILHKGHTPRLVYTYIKCWQKTLFPTDASYLSEAAMQVWSIPSGSGIALQSHVHAATATF